MPLNVNANVIISDDRYGYFNELSIRERFLAKTQAQGTEFGYVSGGNVTPAAPVRSNTIERFPFASATTNTTDVGDTTGDEHATASQSSATSGYISYLNVISKFPFSTTGFTAVDVGDLTSLRFQSAGQSSTTHGYTSAGVIGGTTDNVNIIDRFPFAADGNATDVGDITVGPRVNLAGQSSFTHGYSSGGRSGPSYTPATQTNIIDRFPFAQSTTNATDVGDLSVIRAYLIGQSSANFGYNSGGLNPTTSSNVIDRFPFAAVTTNATDVGDLTVARLWPSGQSSVDYGYTSGGEVIPPAFSNVIDCFPFSATTTNAADVGDLLAAKIYSIGNQA